MLFNTFQFMAFYAIVLVLFLLTRGTKRKLLLLAASYYFYMCWSTKYILVIWAITVVDFVAAIQIEKTLNRSKRKLYLGISLACNLSLLIFFKYLNFLGSITENLLNASGFHPGHLYLKIILPLGLSFHTFQAMCYTVDVYRRKVPAEHSLLSYALYVAFFPQMVAGPIERPNQLLPQFHHDPHLRSERVVSGLRMILWGLFKKMVIADAVAPFVDLIFSRPRTFQGLPLIVGTLLFAIQIYCDFSGYTDMAIGLARIMGYELRINFLQPYFSRSIGEFWRRWHISLSTWFRDYLYIPLGGNRVGVSRYFFNIFITFLISGLWHGAAWNFVVWGALHGTYLIAGELTKPTRNRIYETVGLSRFPRLVKSWQIMATFALVCIGWIFFRASNLGDAWYITTHLLPLGHFDSSILAVGGIPRANAPFLSLLVCLMFVVEWWIAHPSRTPKIWSTSAVRQIAYCACTYCIVFFGVFGRVDFIYFQF